MVDIMAAVVTGHCVWFAQPDALKGSIKETLLVIYRLDKSLAINNVQEVKPTLFFAVPQLWEKLKDVIEVKLQGLQGFQKILISASMVLILYLHSKSIINI